uniref:Glutathione gamma-glutamylcysteinyltransferase n=1 Tax=Macrostomum lignano TaxID=282301 RepID=A0A1I8FA96_9PLAT
MWPPACCVSRRRLGAASWQRRRAPRSGSDSPGSRVIVYHWPIFHLKAWLPPNGVTCPLLAAYHRDSDSVLIMDNDPKPNDPFWSPCRTSTNRCGQRPGSGLPRDSFWRVLTKVYRYMC